MPPPWLLLILALGAPPAGGFVLHLETGCLLSADGQLLEPSWTLFFNKMPVTCFDFEQEQFEPCGLGDSFPWNYTGVPVTQWLMQNFPQLPSEATQQCQQQSQSLWAQTGDRRTPPKVLISPVAPRNTPYPIMLACMAWGFYPRDVNLTWLWNGQPVRDHLDPPQVISNGDWTFQARLTLPVDPKKGGSYTCAVHHASLPAPLTAEWAPGLPMELCVKIGVSVAAMAVGTALLVAGLLLWKSSRTQGYSPWKATATPVKVGSFWTPPPSSAAPQQPPSLAPFILGRGLSQEAPPSPQRRPRMQLQRPQNEETGSP